MAKGKASSLYLHREGLVGHANAPDWNFIYEVSAVRNPRWNIGDRVVLPDGRVFRYCLSHDACDTYKANAFFNAIPATGIDYAVLAAPAAKGDSSVILDNQGTVAQTLDGLRGGNISITEDDNATVQQRGIIGNTAGGVSDEITIYLDAPLTEAVTVSWKGYCMPSPYSAVTKTFIGAIEGGAGKGRVGFCGYAAAPVSAADLYHWEQTWGLIMASTYGNVVGKQQYKREVVFRYDGNLISRGTAGILGLEAQTAGFIMDNNTADNGATQIMLQISP